MEFTGPHALGPTAFAGFPALEQLLLNGVELGEAGAALLASQYWVCLERLDLYASRLGDAGLAALARGSFTALERLELRSNQLTAPLTFNNARSWAPCLAELFQ